MQHLERSRKEREQEVVEIIRVDHMLVFAFNVQSQPFDQIITRSFECFPKRCPCFYRSWHSEFEQVKLLPAKADGTSSMTLQFALIHSSDKVSMKVDESMTSRAASGAFFDMYEQNLTPY